MTVFCGQVYKILLERWCYLSWTVIYTKAKLLDVINTPAKNYPLLPKLKHDDDYWLHSSRQRDRVSLRLYLLKIENQFSLISQSYIISHRHKQYLMTTLYMNDNSITLWQCQVFNLMGISLYFKYTFFFFFLLKTKVTCVEVILCLEGMCIQWQKLTLLNIVRARGTCVLFWGTPFD